MKTTPPLASFASLGARLKDAGAMSGLALAAGSKTAMDEDEAASAGGFGQFYKASPGRHPCFVPYPHLSSCPPPPSLEGALIARATNAARAANLPC